MKWMIERCFCVEGVVCVIGVCIYRRSISGALSILVLLKRFGSGCVMVSFLLHTLLIHLPNKKFPHLSLPPVPLPSRVLVHILKKPD